jgi:hypothetical protein
MKALFQRIQNIGNAKYDNKAGIREKIQSMSCLFWRYHKIKKETINHNLEKSHCGRLFSCC